jgi:DNA (cytosine-5)-methyltransferase 1
LLDLYCGAGGAAMGYNRAGYDVVGVDIKPQRHYPFTFIRADALEVVNAGAGSFDVIHASPPCQKYSVLRNVNAGREYPDLVGVTRELLETTGLPWVMENVPGAPTNTTFVLCGSMFGLGVNGFQLRRHRVFESNVMMLTPQCQHEGETIGVYGHGPTDNRHGVRGRRGGYQGNKADNMAAMDIDWMGRNELAQAVPPAYTEWIGAQMLRTVDAQRSTL